MLNGKLSLFEVEDVEALCSRVIEQSQLELSFHDREDLLAWLLATAWQISEDYEPSDPPRFAVHLKGLLRKRIIDWQRGKYRTRWQFADRTYERAQPILVPLEDRPDVPDHAQSVDVDVHSEAALRGLLRERGSNGHRGNGALGEETNDVAA